MTASRRTAPPTRPTTCSSSELRRVAGSPTPCRAAGAAAAQAAFAWAAVAGMPARLAYDSRSVGGRRGDMRRRTRPAHRAVHRGRGTARVEIELELDIGADKLRLLGHVRPARRATVVVRVPPRARTTAATDEGGTFRVDELACRPFCVVVDGSSGR